MNSPSLNAPKKSQPVSIKSVALPHEHGVWGFWFEPSLLGLALFPSLAGLSLALAALAALLCQQPLSLYLSDVQRQKHYPRTDLAKQFTIIYATLTFCLFIFCLFTATNLQFLYPLFFAFPLASIQFLAKLQHQGRKLIPELAGVTAIAALAASLSLLGAASTQLALTLWFILVARNLPSILYVRARLRLERKESINRLPALSAGILALVIMIFLARYDLVPALVVEAFLLLFLRAALGLSMRRPLKAKTIGILELIYGLAVVVATIIGSKLNL